MESPSVALQISVLVPTYGRPERIETLIAALSAQTVSKGTFEVVIVDDGGHPAVSLDVRGLPFDCTVLQRRNAGPAAARNAGLALIAAPLVLILNDDAVPAPDLIERHLAAHAGLDATAAQQTAVLGTFHFTEDARKSPFVQVLDATDRLFAFSSLVHGQRYGAEHFWTCNLSLPIASILGVGGFDQDRFDKAICEDVELGVRLVQKGMSVLFDERCIAHHAHSITPSDYARRAVQLGLYQRRLEVKHGASDLDHPSAVAAVKESILKGFGERLASADAYFRELEARERDLAGQALTSAAIADTALELKGQSEVYRQAGVYLELTGADLVSLCRAGAPQKRLAAVIVSFNALQNTQRCIASLRASADPRYPLHIIVVDNGSTDGSADWLRQQSGLRTIFNPDNYGAPRARNQGLALVEEGTDWIGFFDNDVVFPKGWMERALFHGAADPEVGSIALCANRASKGQVLPYSGSSEQSEIDAFAAQHAASSPQCGADGVLFTSLAVLVRADVLERIGGFDESFSPWGFEDDDIALRIRLAGWRNRIAKDTFVFHAAYDGPVKEQQHAAWLHLNWESFLRKWSPEALGSPLFDYSRVEVPQLGEATEKQLCCPLPAEGAAPPSWPGKTAPVAKATAQLRTEVLEPAAGAAPTRHAIPGQGQANIMVLGCGRSGASVAAGMLEGAGWHVGDRPYPAREADGQRTFETAEINGINEFLLAPAVRNEAPMRNMQHWLSYAPEPLDFDVPSGLRARMNRLGEKGPFAYKDARFCYTLDAWRPSVPDAKFVCIFREPAATAHSITKEIREADFMRGCDVDFDGALKVWNAMYRRILDDHSETGEWLFLHFDQLFTSAGVSRLEAFVGGSVAADFPDAKPEQPGSYPPIPPAVADTFAELCQRARATDVPAPPVTHRYQSVAKVEEPEITVLISTHQKKDALLRSLASLERQSAAGRYEIVIVNDGATDGTREALDAWEPKAPLRVVHQENGGLCAARNAGLAVSRGKYVLFVDDDIVAAPDLVEQHLLAHAQEGPRKAAVGALGSSRAALDNALMRVLEPAATGFCRSDDDPSGLPDWNRFRSCNVSVSRDDIHRVGGFDESFRRHGCETTDLAYRLYSECGTRVVYAPAARVEQQHTLTFDALRARSHAVSAAYVRFFHKHPETLSHPFWEERSTTSLADKEAMLVKTLPDRSRAEAIAKELSAIDLGAIERSGPEGESIAETIVEHLAAYLNELNRLWWMEGEVDAIREGVGQDAIRRARRAEQAATGELLHH